MVTDLEIRHPSRVGKDIMDYCPWKEFANTIVFARLGGQSQS
jgi:hypothetical protein